MYMKSPFDLDIITAIKDRLVQRRQTLSVAESVTAGALQLALSQAADASSFFQGGITTYNVGQKCRLLGVEPIFAVSCDCVDITVAEKMALESNKLFLSHYAIGITGYASKVPEAGKNDLYCFLAIARERNIILSTKITAPADNEGIGAQYYYTDRALFHLLEFLQYGDLKTEKGLFSLQDWQQ